MKWLAYGIWVIVWFFIDGTIFSILGYGAIPAIIEIGIGVLGFRLIHNHFNNQSKNRPILTEPVKSKQETQTKNSPQIEKNASQVKNNESEDLYASALIEVNEGRPQLGFWARCLAEADGDKDKATANYIKLRVAQLER